MMELRAQIIEQLHMTKGQVPAFSYERISDEIQAKGSSLEYQAEQAIIYAQSQKLALVHAFSIVESASKVGRKVFNQMLDLAVHFNVKHLIFKNTDRFSRNYVDLVRVEKLVKEQGFTVHFYQQGMTLHAEAPYHLWMMFGLMISFAKGLSDKLTEDKRLSHRHKRAKGIPHMCAYGYKFENKIPVIDPALESTLRYIFDTFDKGNFSLTMFGKHLNEQGIRAPKGGTWDEVNPGAIYELLTNPFYHGEWYSKTHDQTFKGSYQPYYDKSRWVERCKRLKTRNTGHRKRRLQFLLAGRMHCPCGKTMSGDQKKVKRAGGTHGFVTYYTHKCSESTHRYVSIREERAFELIARALRQIPFTMPISENLKTLFGDFIRAQSRTSERQTAAITTKIRKVERDKSRLLELLLDGEISKDTLYAKVREKDTEQERLRREWETLSVDNSLLITKTADIIDTLQKMPATYENATVEHKVKILKTFTKTVVIKDDVARIEWDDPFAFLMTDQILAIAVKVRDHHAVCARQESNLRPFDS